MAERLLRIGTTVRSDSLRLGLVAGQSYRCALPLRKRNRQEFDARNCYLKVESGVILENYKGEDMSCFAGRVIAAISMLLLFQTVVASPLVDRTVRHVGTYGNGVMFVLFSAPIPEPGCESSEVRIAAAHPERQNWIAMLLAVSQTGATLSIMTEGCSGNYPILGQTTGSALLVQAN